MSSDDNYSVAIHEAGHSVAASHWKIPSYPEVLRDGQSVATQTAYPDYAGLCSYDGGLIPPFQFAVISWSGMMAHCLFGDPPAWAPPFKPSAKLLRDWHGMIMQQIRRLSDGDRAGILGCRDTWRSCKSAFRIVRSNQARIVRLAKAMTGARRERAVSSPDKFPATFADFLQRIVAAGGVTDPEEKFRTFVRSGIEKFFAEKNLGLEPEQHRQAVECWTAARIAQYQRGFTGEDSWRSAALTLRKWQTRQL